MNKEQKTWLFHLSERVMSGWIEKLQKNQKNKTWTQSNYEEQKWKHQQPQLSGIMHELFSQATTSSINTRHSYMKLTQPFRKRNFGKNNLSFLGPKIWNELPESIKNSNLLNTFKHKVKDHFFSIMENKENCHFIFY